LHTHWIGRDEPAEQAIARWLYDPARARRARIDPARGVPFDGIPAPLRLAAEMALHDDEERRALAGELGALYARWQEAERIARVADGQLTRVPPESSFRSR
jgi:hypothetical protein